MKKTSINFKIFLFSPLFSEPGWWNLLEESKKKYTSQNVFYKRFSLTRAMRRVSRVPSNQDQWCQPSTNSQHRVKNISQGGFLVSFYYLYLIHKNLHRATTMNLRKTRPPHNWCCPILVSKIPARLQSCLHWNGAMFHVQKGQKIGEKKCSDLSEIIVSIVLSQRYISHLSTRAKLWLCAII